MEELAKQILESHGCKFIKMLSECTVYWEDKLGNTYVDDIATLYNMTDSAWDFWKTLGISS